MSDRISRLLAEYAAGVDPERLPRETIHEVEGRILDSIGVAVAGSDEPAARAARAYAASMPEADGARIWGTRNRSNVEAAAFANGVAVRCLDFNDTYLSREPLHPSDVIPALLAVADRSGADEPGRAERLIASIATAYEIGVALCDAASLRLHGWDHVNVIGIAVAGAAGSLFGLGVETIEHAIAIAAVPHAAMRQTRVGELSMWKGAAAANAARNAVSAVQIARAGMTGPFEPFEGEMGFVRQVLAGEAFDEGAFGALVRGDPPLAILRTHVKLWPVEYHAQSAVDAALQIHPELGADAPAAIADIEIDTFRASYEIIAADREKWDPRTRETADHSLPYITLAALMDGTVGSATFDEGRFRDERTLDLLGRAVSIHEDHDLTQGYPDGIPNRVTVMTEDGRTLVRQVRFPRGHARNPMTDDELVAKFRANADGRWKPERAERVTDLVWRLHDDEDALALLLAELGGEP
jgi:2-methylcitrate dehydratase